jgi:hypothetical protein
METHPLINNFTAGTRGRNNSPAGIREHSGNIQGTFREHSGNIQGTFREHSGNIQCESSLGVAFQNGLRLTVNFSRER